LINAIIVWNTRYYQALGQRLPDVADEIWAHLSPICWDHIQLVGAYSFDELALTEELRPLLLPDEDR